MVIIIRKVVENDLEECVNVIRTGFGTVAKDFNITIQNCSTNGAFMTLDRLTKDFKLGKPMYVAISNNRIVGFFEVEDIGVKDFGHAVELQKITVLPEYRHEGIGKMLFNKAITIARALGAQVMTIGIIEENTVLKEWYAKNGCQHNGTRIVEHLPFTVGYMSYIL